jgi:hypothetical protein
MFVEVYYEYQPLVKTSLSPTSNFTEIASMMVRDRRDLSQIYNAESATSRPLSYVKPLLFRGGLGWSTFSMPRLALAVTGRRPQPLP